MLTFARGVDGQRAPLQPKYLLKETAQILHETLPRNIRVELALAGELPAVTGDATQLQAVMSVAGRYDYDAYCAEYGFTDQRTSERQHQERLGEAFAISWGPEL